MEVTGGLPGAGVHQPVAVTDCGCGAVFAVGRLTDGRVTGEAWANDHGRSALGGVKGLGW